MREAVLESLLINHPLDCPICDQAGECKLQEYSVEYGQAASRFAEEKVHKPKHVDLGPRIVLDDERCILCSRCIRFTRDIAGDDALGFVERGSHSTLTRYPGKPFDNNYTLNTVDICPVGALTSKDFRFQMRVWFLKESKSVCTSCSTGCNIVIGSREEKVYRYEPRRKRRGQFLLDVRRRPAQLQMDQPRRPAHPGGRDQIPAAGGADGLARGDERNRHVVDGSGERHGGHYCFRPADQRGTLFAAKAGHHFGALTDSCPAPGQADGLLVNADRNPNANGALLTGFAAAPLGSTLPRIADGIAGGAIKTLLVFGEDVTKHGVGADLLDRLQMLVVSDILPNATTAMAHYLLPGCAHVEKHGSFVNGKGRVQRFMQNIQPKGQCAGGMGVFARTGRTASAGRTARGALRVCSTKWRREMPAFKGLTWAGLGDLGVTVPI